MTESKYTTGCKRCNGNIPIYALTTLTHQYQRYQGAILLQTALVQSAFFNFFSRRLTFQVSLQHHFFCLVLSPTISWVYTYSTPWHLFITCRGSTVLRWTIARFFNLFKIHLMTFSRVLHQMLHQDYQFQKTWFCVLNLWWVLYLVYMCHDYSALGRTNFVNKY